MPTLFTTEEIEKLSSIDLYKFLCITPEEFTPEKVRKQYKKLIVKYHPDKNPNDKLSAQKSQMIEAAYNVLYNPLSKETYDRLREEQESNEDDFEDLKKPDRGKIGPKKLISKEQMYSEIRKKNLELDPEYYSTKLTGKITNEEIANQLESRNDPSIDEELKEKFKRDAEMLNSIDNQEERQQKFNEMFNSGITLSSNSTEIQPYNKGKSYGSYALARTNQTETMFSDVDELEDQFAIQHHELDEEDGTDLDFETYRTQYLESLQDGSKLSEKVRASTLKNGRADYRYDED